MLFYGLLVPRVPMEQFFSQAGNITNKPNKLDDNHRRLAFMVELNGDIEGRLL